MSTNQQIQEPEVYILRNTTQMRVYFIDETSHFINIPKGTHVYNLRNYNEFHNNYCQASVLFWGKFSETELQSTNFYMKYSIKEIEKNPKGSPVSFMIINITEFDKQITSF